MITGTVKRPPDVKFPVVELSMSLADADRIRSSLDATGKLCASLIAVGRHGEPVPGSLINQLPDVVIRALREQAQEHFDMREVITKVTAS